MADVSIDVDLREFNAAVQKMFAYSSKSAAEVINRQGRNVCFRAAQFTPKAIRADILDDISPPFVSYVANKKHGKGNWGWSDWSALKKKLPKQRSTSIGYMKSAWAKAGKLFPPTKPDAGPSVRKPRPARHSAATARVLAAMPERLRCLIEPIWSGDNTPEGKDSIAEEARRAAMRYLVRDMEKYMARQQQKAWDKAASEASRAVGAFVK